MIGQKLKEIRLSRDMSTTDIIKRAYEYCFKNNIKDNDFYREKINRLESGEYKLGLSEVKLWSYAYDVEEDIFLQEIKSS